MIVKRVTHDRSVVALNLLSRYVPKMTKMPLPVAKAVWKKPWFWFIILLVVGIGTLYATRRYHRIDPLKLVLSLIFKKQ